MNIQPGSRYIPTLDGWRSVAIFLVLLEHGSESIAEATGFSLFYKIAADGYGGLGVHIFFGISGFLITSLLLDEERRNGFASLKSFYVRRFFRIVPAALLVLLTAGVLALCGIIPLTGGQWFGTLIFFANYLPGPRNWYLGHFWSLAVEEHFYFLWPTAFLVLATVRRRAAVAIALALALALWRTVDFKYHITSSIPEVFWGRTDIQGDGLLWGVVIALLNVDPLWRPRLHRLVTSPAIWILPAIVIAGYSPLFAGTGWKVHAVLLIVEVIAIPLTILATVVHPQGIAGKLLEAAPLRWLGKLSYSVYLWQQLFVCPIDRRAVDLGIMQTFPVNLLLAFACAALSFYLVETPLRDFGHRIAKRLNFAQKTAPAALTAA